MINFTISDWSNCYLFTFCNYFTYYRKLLTTMIRAQIGDNLFIYNIRMTKTLSIQVADVLVIRVGSEKIWNKSNDLNNLGRRKLNDVTCSISILKSPHTIKDLLFELRLLRTSLYLNFLNQPRSSDMFHFYGLMSKDI